MVFVLRYCIHGSSVLGCVIVGIWYCGQGSSVLGVVVFVVRYRGQGSSVLVCLVFGVGGGSEWRINRSEYSTSMGEIKLCNGFNGCF